MKRVAVVTDSIANLPAELIRQLDICVVPTVVLFQGRSYFDGRDVTAGEVYGWLRHDQDIPTTSAPSVADFVRVYAGLAPQVDGIASIHAAPQLTGTYNNALAASQLVDETAIRVVNSKTAAMCEGFAVLEAARAAAAGADLEAVVARAADVAGRTRLLAAVDTLHYLHRGGRINGAIAMLGSVLQIKPVVTLKDGAVDVAAKPRTMARALRFMIEEMARQADGRPLHVAVLHADVPDKAGAVRQQIAGTFDCAELYVTEMTPVMGTHTGPGLLGVAYYAGKGAEGL